MTHLVRKISAQRFDRMFAPPVARRAYRWRLTPARFDKAFIRLAG